MSWYSNCILLEAQFVLFFIKSSNILMAGFFV